MAYLELKHLSFYFENGLSKQEILKDVNIIFPNAGLISIIGESGSGKSTLLNLIGGYITKYQGEIISNVPYSNYGVVFQNYYLIPHLNVIDNVILPCLLYGKKRKNLKKEAIKILDIVGLKNLYYRKIDELSIGQKARVAIARGLINNSQILLLDEPTGSLDSENAINIMELLKQLSKTRLIIVVTHNKLLADLYSKKVYLLKNKRLNLELSNEFTNKTKQEGNIKNSKSKISILENIFLAFSFIKKRFVKVLLSLVFISICFALMIICLNLNNSGKEYINNYFESAYDYNLVKITKKKSYEIDNQDMNLIKMVSLDNNDQKEIKKGYSNIEFYPSLEYFLPSAVKIKYNDSYLDENVYLSPCFPTSTKLSKGETPTSYLDVVINKDFKDLILNKNSYNQSGLNLSLDCQITSTYYGKEVNDLINFDFNFNVVGEVNESSIVSRPTIYYSYDLMNEYILSLKLNNLSEVINNSNQVDIKYRLEMLSNENDKLTGFETIARVDNPSDFKNYIETNYSDLYNVDSYYLLTATSFVDIISSMTSMILIFLILAVISSFFLEIVFIENLYEEKKEEYAIYLSFHISKNTFFSLNFGQTIILFSISTILSNIFYTFVSILLNSIIKNYGFSNMFEIYIPLLYQILLMILNFLFCYISSYIPLRRIYKKDLVLSLKGE